MTVATLDFLERVGFYWGRRGVFSYLYVNPFLTLCVKYVKNNIANKYIVVEESQNQASTIN